MDHDAHHDALITDLVSEYQELFDRSEQAIYVYLDDAHKACNAKFASLLGYASADEWAAVSTPFPPTFVDEQSQPALVDAYQAAIERKVAATIPIHWKKKSGGTVATIVIIVPIIFEDHILALHFIAS